MNFCAKIYAKSIEIYYFFTIVHVLSVSEEKARSIFAKSLPVSLVSFYTTLRDVFFFFFSHSKEWVLGKFSDIIANKRLRFFVEFLSVELKVESIYWSEYKSWIGI